MSMKEQIIEFLIVNQPLIKASLRELEESKEALLASVNPIERFAVVEQYDARIKQWVAFFVSDNNGLPIENVIIELEYIDLEDFLNV